MTYKSQHTKDLETHAKERFQLETRITELEIALETALSCIGGLFGQQAMPDDSFDADVEEIQMVLDNKLVLE